MSHNFCKRFFKKIMAYLPVEPADIFFCHLRFIANQLVDADMKKSGKLRQKRDIRIGGAGLPFGDGSIGNGQRNRANRFILSLLGCKRKFPEIQGKRIVGFFGWFLYGDSGWGNGDQTGRKENTRIPERMPDSFRVLLFYMCRNSRLA